MSWTEKILRLPERGHLHAGDAEQAWASEFTSGQRVLARKFFV